MLFFFLAQPSSETNLLKTPALLWGFWAFTFILWVLFFILLISEDVIVSRNIEIIILLDQQLNLARRKLYFRRSIWFSEQNALLVKETKKFIYFVLIPRITKHWFLRQIPCWFIEKKSRNPYSFVGALLKELSF